MTRKRQTPQAPREQWLSNYHGWQMFLRKLGNKYILVLKWSL